MSFDVTKITAAPDGKNWLMEFFDARSEYTFCELLDCLRSLGVPFPAAPDPPAEGFSIASTWRGIDLTVGFSDEYGCHLVSADKTALAELSALTQNWKA